MPDVEALAASSAAVERLGHDSGRPWRVWSWNRATSTPHLAYGGFQLPVSRVADAGEAERQARSFISSRPDLFPVGASDLVLASVGRMPGKWSVILAQTHRGVPVIDGRATVTMTDAGRVFVLGNDLFPGISISIDPVVGEDEASRRAVAELGRGLESDVVGADLVVLPLQRTGGVEHRLAWRVNHRTSSPPGDWMSFIDAISGDVLWRFDRVMPFDFLGVVEADVEYPDYCAGTSSDHPMSGMTVVVDGLPPTTTDLTGAWAVPFGGIEVRDVTFRFEGTYFDVNIFPDGSSDSEIVVSAVSGNTEFTYLDLLNSQAVERDSWRYANRIHDWMKGIDPGFTSLDYLATLWVNRTDGFCPGNAWYDPGDGSLNFCAENITYANTGRIGDVSYHEYGHIVTDLLYAAPLQNPPPAIQEGNSDIVAVLLSGSPIIGHGLYNGNCSGGIRNASNTLRYPEDLTGAAHHDGQILAGVLWDTYEQLVIALGNTSAARTLSGQLWHYSRVMGFPMTMPDQVFWTFVADDDNGDLLDGTPHHSEICIGATNHGFDCPEISLITISHPGIETVVGGHADITATVESSVAAIDSVTLVYRIDGGVFQQIDMPLISGSEYTVVLLGLETPSEVDYYIVAADDVGNQRPLPWGAPASVFHFDVARYYDNLETDEGWVVDLEETDTATAGIWVRVDPNGTIAQSEDDHTVEPGVTCWVTGNAPAGTPGSPNDVDDGVTSVYSPLYNLSGISDGKLKYWRWYSNDKGAAPGTDTWVVQVRNNGGPWRDVERTTISSNAWTQNSYTISGLILGALGDIQVKFVASDLGPASTVEAGVDDFAILADLGGAVEVELDPVPAGSPAASYLAGARPNPCNPRTTIRYGLGASADVVLQIFDVSGRLVTTLVRTTQGEGHYAVVWNGTDSGGHDVSSGVYYAQLVAGGFRSLSRLTVLR